MADGDDKGGESGAPPKGGMRSDTLAAVRPLSSLTDKEAGVDDDNKAAGGQALVDADDKASIGESDTLVAAATPLSGEPSLGESDTLAASGTDLATPAPRRPRTTGRRSALDGRTIAGRYTIDKLLGKGGMSEVYIARHELLNKGVAIKVLKEELASSRAALERFHREAIAAAAIGDPHIVDVTDYGFTDEGDAYIVMELLEGRDLRRLLRDEGALPSGRAVAIARQILRALRAAHQREIIHRDLKAENVFLTTRDDQEFVKLLDFGISKVRFSSGDGDEGEEQSLTSTGMVMGTPQYIAPEQAHAHSDLDHRVDIYAMGVILYEMLTGDLPFDGETALELMMKHVQEPPEPPRRRRPDLAIPPDLEAVVLKALEKKREDRYATAQEMLDALPGSDALTGGYASISTGRAQGAVGLPRRSGGLPAVLVGIGLLLLGLGYIAYRVLKPEATTPLAVVSPVDAGASPIVAAKRLDAEVEADSAKVASPTSKPAPTSAKAEVVELRLEVSPKGARLEADGKPLVEPILRGPVGTVVKLRASARGYVTAERAVRLDGKGKRLELKLRKKRRGGTKKPKGGDLKDNPYG